MKKSTPALLLGACVTVSGISVYSFQQLKNRKLITAAKNATLPEGFTVTAHTGCEGTEDNTLESVLAGINAGADIVEIDLHFLSEKTPVLSHNEPQGNNKKNLPLLDDAFSLLAGYNVKMNVDVKSTADMPAVLSLAQKHSVTDKIFFTGVEEKDVDTVKNGAPDIPYYLNVSVDKKKNTDRFYLSALVQKVKNCGAIGINMKFVSASTDLIKAFHEEGLLVSLWTANAKKDMYRCLSLAPDNITTRKPSELISLM